MRLLVLLLLGLAAGCGRDDAIPPPPEPVAPDPPAELVDNPVYANWAKFKPGTTVVLRSVTQTAGVAEKTITTTRYTLKELTDAYAVVETQASTRRYDGFETNNPPDQARHSRRMPLPPGVRAADFGKPPKGSEHGEEKLTIAGKDYPARWYTTRDRNEAGEVLTRVWSSVEIPGRLAKSVSQTPGVGKTTTTEVVVLQIIQK